MASSNLDDAPGSPVRGDSSWWSGSERGQFERSLTIAHNLLIRECSDLGSPEDLLSVLNPHPMKTTGSTLVSHLLHGNADMDLFGVFSLRSGLDLDMVRHGKKSMLVYLTECSLVGGLSVVAIQGLGAAIVSQVGGTKQYDQPFLYIIFVSVAATLLTEMVFLNVSSIDRRLSCKADVDT
jgi:hypothetical protein